MHKNLGYAIVILLLAAAAFYFYIYYHGGLNYFASTSTTSINYTTPANASGTAGNQRTLDFNQTGFVADENGTVLALDLLNGSAVESLELPNASSFIPPSILIYRDAIYVAVADASSKVYVVNAVTDNITSNFSAGMEPVSLSAGNQGFAYMADPGNFSVYLINLSRGIVSVIKTDAVPNSATALHGNVYVANFNNYTVLLSKVVKYPHITVSGQY